MGTPFHSLAGCPVGLRRAMILAVSVGDNVGAGVKVEVPELHAEIRMDSAIRLKINLLFTLPSLRIAEKPSGQSMDCPEASKLSKSSHRQNNHNSIIYVHDRHRQNIAVFLKCLDRNIPNIWHCK